MIPMNAGWQTTRNQTLYPTGVAILVPVVLRR
jgi:hypothetical protein